MESCFSQNSIFIVACAHICTELKFLKNSSNRFQLPINESLIKKFVYEIRISWEATHAILDASKNSQFYNAFV